MNSSETHMMAVLFQVFVRGFGDLFKVDRDGGRRRNLRAIIRRSCGPSHRALGFPVPSLVTDPAVGFSYALLESLEALALRSLSLDPLFAIALSSLSGPTFGIPKTTILCFLLKSLASLLIA